MSEASRIVTHYLPESLKPQIRAVTNHDHKVNPPDPLGLDITSDGLWAVTAPGELFEAGQRWRIAEPIGPGFDSTERLLINRDAATGDLRSHIAQCIGELIMSLAGIEGDHFPALAALIPESAEVAEPQEYPLIRVPDDLWAGCWANPNQNSREKTDLFGEWIWDQPFASVGTDGTMVR